RGVVAVLLLAGAVAGASAFPRLLAGPGGGQTPTFAVPRAASQPAIVHAPAAPPLHVAPVVQTVRTAIVVAPLMRRPAPAIAVIRTTPRSIVPHPVALQPAPAPAPAPAAAPVVVAAPAPPPPQVVPADTTKGNGKAKGHDKKGDRVIAIAPAAPAPTDQPSAPAPLGSQDGPSAQAPPRPDSGDRRPVRPVEAPVAAAASPGDGHGPPPWAHGGGKGH